MEISLWEPLNGKKLSIRTCSNSCPHSDEQSFVSTTPSTASRASEVEIKARLSRGVLPALQALAVEAVVAQRGEDPVHRLIHPLQAHSALGQLCQVHHRQAGPLQAPSREKLLSTFPSPAINSNFPSVLAPGLKMTTQECCEATQCLEIHCKGKKVILNNQRATGRAQ